MTHVRVQQYGGTERLAAAAELAALRAQGLRPAPRRNLAPVEPFVRRLVPEYASWPVLAVVAIQVVTLAATWAVIR